MTTSSQVLVNSEEGPGTITSFTLRKNGLGLAAIATGAAMIAFLGAWSAAQIVRDGGAGPASW